MQIEESKLASTINFLLEVASWEERVPKLMQMYHKTKKEIEDRAALDPTDNKGYVEWILRQEAKRDVIFPEDNDKVRDVLTDYDKIKNKADFKASVGNKQIFQFKAWGDLSRAIEDFKGIKTAAQGFTEIPGAKLLFQWGIYDIIKITSVDALMKLSQESRWCTQNKGYATNYLKDAPAMYKISKAGKSFALFSPCISETWHLKNRDDVPPTVDQMTEMFPILVKLGVHEQPGRGGDWQAYPEAEENYLVKTLSHRTSSELAKSAKDSYNFAKSVKKAPFPEGEAAIATDPMHSYLYAKNVLHEKRFPAGEPVIIKNPEYLWLYTKNIIKGAWPEVEDIFAANAELAFRYAKEILRNRFVKGEPIIAKNGIVACRYAAEVIGAAFPEGEPAIAKNSQAVLQYIGNVLTKTKQRFPAAEAQIITKPDTAYWYAFNVVGKRWKKGEAIITTNPYYSVFYALNVIKGPFPEGEAIIKTDPYSAHMYQSKVPGVKAPRAKTTKRASKKVKEAIDQLLK